jgi:hypothetical protein
LTTLGAALVQQFPFTDSAPNATNVVPSFPDLARTRRQDQSWVEVGESTLMAQKLLALDPTDNLHARYQAVLGNIEIGNWASAERILRQYRHDIGTNFAYSRVLICHHNQGNPKPLLKAAVASNLYVAGIIDQRVAKPNGIKAMPGSMEEASALHDIEGLKRRGYASANTGYRKAELPE